MKKKILLFIVLIMFGFLLAIKPTYAYSPDVVNAMPLPNFEILDTYEVTLSNYPIILDYTNEYVTSYKVVEVILNQELNDGYPVTWYSLTSAQAPTSEVITFVSFREEAYKHDDVYLSIGNKSFIQEGLEYKVLQYQNTPNVLGGNKSYITLQFTQNSTAIFVFRSSVNIATQSALLEDWLNSGRFYNGSYTDFYATYINNVTSNLDEQYNNGYSAGFSAGKRTLDNELSSAYIEGYDDGKEQFGMFHNNEWITATTWGNIQYNLGLNNDFDYFEWMYVALSLPALVLNIEIWPSFKLGYFILASVIFGLIAWVIKLGRRGL